LAFPPNSSAGLWTANVTTVPAVKFATAGSTYSTRKVEANLGSASTGVRFPEKPESGTTLCTVARNPSEINWHLHYCRVYLGRTIIKTNDHFTAGSWTGFDSGSGINRPEDESTPPGLDSSEIVPNPGYAYFQRPKIAQSWNDLQQMLRNTGAGAEGSVA
jgi:hypothetical protein